MPSWSIHLSVAKKINKKLKLNKDIFYIGNIIPDIKYKDNITRRDTHYDLNNKCKKCPSERLPDINKFLSEYKDKLKDTLILGYYIHLLTDYYYNNFIFSNCWIQNKNNEIIGIKLINNKIKKINKNNYKIRKEYKHYDFELYGRYLFNNNYVELPKYTNKFKNSITLLKNNFYTIEEIKEKIYYLNNDFINFNKYKLHQKIFGLKYKLLKKEEYDKLFNNCINFILEELKKHDLI